MTRIIFMASVQHTGTNFLQMLLGYVWHKHILLQLGYFYKYRKSVVYGNDGSIVEVSSKPELLSAIKHQIHKGIAKVHPEDGHIMALIHAHFGDPLKSFISHSYIDFLVGEFGGVFPVRDPLASLISRRCRIKGTGGMFNSEHYRYQVNGFVYMAHLWKEYPGSVFFFPMEPYMTLPEFTRVKMLIELLEFMGIEHPDWDRLHRYASEPPVLGSLDQFMATHKRNQHEMKVSSYLKEAYEQGNFRAICRKMPVETGYLRGNETAIRPFLEHLGYKNLIWWS